MGWLVGIISVIIIVCFWRVFLPIAVVLGLVLGAWLLNVQHQNDIDRKEAAAAAREKATAQKELRVRIATAQKYASSYGRKWVVSGSLDPASNKKIARMASITSNDGLCSLTVQKRIDGTRLAGLDCTGIKISKDDDIYIKFDTDDTSKKMDIKNYSDSDRVYIPSFQSDYYGYTSYQYFMNRLVTANAVAVKIPAVGGFWVRFTLKGSAAAINHLGKEISSANR